MTESKAHTLNLYSDEAPTYLDIKRADIPEVSENAPSINIAVAGDLTLTPFRDALHTMLATLDIHAHIHELGFGQWQQEIRNPASELHKRKTDILFIIPDAASMYEGAEQPDRAIKLLEESIANACVFVDTVIVGTVISLSPQVDCVQWSLQCNQVLGELASSLPNVFTLDLQQEAVLTPRQVIDRRLYYYGQFTYSPDFQTQLAWRMTGACLDKLGKRAKVIVTDLDNTLWGGIIGEDGIDAIRVGSANEGRPYRDMQLALQAHQRNGILLAICSKNDEPVALEAIDKHPAMVLRSSDFAAWCINWDDKAQNIKRLSQTLGLGLDQFIFIDDNPAERLLVQQSLPEVIVPDLPQDMTRWPMLIHRLIHCQALSVSNEDRKRTKLYQQRASASALQASSTNMEEYLRELEMQVSCATVTEGTLPRVAQLVHKTNQFNLTTLRHSQQDISEMLSSTQHIVTCMRVKDIFGDHGIIGVGILAIEEQNMARIDTFLLSCRIIGRRLEDVLFLDLAKRARSLGIQTLTAKYVPTERNGQMKDILAHWGFSTKAGSGNKELSLNNIKLPGLDVFSNIASDVS